MINNINNFSMVRNIHSSNNYNLEALFSSINKMA